MTNSDKENQKKTEQAKLLHRMQKEIGKMEHEIKFFRVINLKNNTIKNLKITARALQMVAPYVVTAGITAGIFTALGNCPFYRDNLKYPFHTMKEFDNKGNIRYEQQYEAFEEDTNLLYYYSRWEKAEGDFFTRIAHKYKIEELTEEKIYEIFNKENITIQDILGNPVSSITETKNNLSPEELEEEQYFQAVLYSEDQENFIIKKEPVGDNVAIFLLYAIATIFAEILPFFFRSEISSFDFGDCVYEIKENAKNIDIEVLRKKLEIKKDNYNRLMR